MVTNARFIRSIGYETEEDLYAASELIVREGPDIGWYVTPHADSIMPAWVAWDDANPATPGFSLHRTREEAIAFQLAGAENVPGVTIEVDAP